MPVVLSKAIFQHRHKREFLYSHEVDAVIGAMERTRYHTRNRRSPGCCSAAAYSHPSCVGYADSI